MTGLRETIDNSYLFDILSLFFFVSLKYYNYRPVCPFLSLFINMFTDDYTFQML